MLFLNFQLTTPLFRTYFVNLWNKAIKCSKYKAFEAEICFQPSTLFEVFLNITTRGDHAGIDVSVTVLGVCIHLLFYDIRHWNYKTNTWEVYEETNA
jgi:hypothetical protein